LNDNKRLFQTTPIAQLHITITRYVTLVSHPPANNKAPHHKQRGIKNTLQSIDY